MLGLVTLAVANRPGPMPPVDAAVLRTPHRVVPLPMLDISATDIRSRVARGLPIDSLVPPAVARYIASHASVQGIEWTSANCNAPSSMASKT